MPTKLSEDGRHLIQHYESCKLETYVCSGGKLTIGYGHTGTARMGQRITQAQADALFTADVATFENHVARVIRLSADLAQHQFDALVSFAFNCRDWHKSTLVRLVNAGDHDAAADEFRRWIYAAGKPMLGLQRRRHAERLVYSGESDARAAIAAALVEFPNS